MNVLIVDDDPTSLKNKYLSKPVSVETIIPALHEVIAMPHAAPQPKALPEVELLKEYNERLVSKLKGKNTELMAAEGKFLALVEQSIVGIYIVQDDQFVYVNPGMLGISGRSEEEMTSRTIYDFIVPEDRALARENIHHRISGRVPSTKAHLFEPFFTTKGIGKGMGLGLATVFGIVKQSGGDITVETEPGEGATFTVILPSQLAPRRPGGSGASLRAVLRGTETVLAVEDEDAVRRIVKIALESAGYRVIEARNGCEALEAVRRHAGAIHLVVTDVVMPEMSGRELAERIVKDHPGVRILYMSGYMDDAVMRHGIVESGVAFLQKPFTPLALARKVREVLDGKAV